MYTNQITCLELIGFLRITIPITSCLRNVLMISTSISIILGEIYYSPSF